MTSKSFRASWTTLKEKPADIAGRLAELARMPSADAACLRPRGGSMMKPKPALPLTFLVIPAALVIGAALIATEVVGAKFRPSLARLAQIKDAAYPAAARASGPSRLEQLAATKDGTLLEIPAVVGPSSSRLETLATLKDSSAPAASSAIEASASWLEQLAAQKESTVPADYGIRGASPSRLEALAAVKDGSAPLAPSMIGVSASRLEQLAALKAHLPPLPSSIAQVFPSRLEYLAAVKGEPMP